MASFSPRALCRKAKKEGEEVNGSGELAFSIASRTGTEVHCRPWRTTCLRAEKVTPHEEFAAVLLCIFAVAHAASGPSGPAELNDKLVVSATGAPWKIVSSTDLHYHMQGNNATAFDHDDMHNHVVAHYKKEDAKDELPEPSALASISPQMAKPLDKQREAEVAAGGKSLHEEKEGKKEDLEVISMAKAKTDSKPALDAEEEAVNKESKEEL